MTYHYPLNMLEGGPLIAFYAVSLIPAFFLARIFESAALTLCCGVVILDEYSIPLPAFSTKPLLKCHYEELLKICHGDSGAKSYVKNIRASGRELVDGEFRLLKLWYKYADCRKSYKEVIAFVERSN